jgi:hypothetical protein
LVINKAKEFIFETTKFFSNVSGPFKKEGYLQKREELGVLKELQLKE